MRGKRLPKEIKAAKGTLRPGRDSDLEYDKTETVPSPPEHFTDPMRSLWFRLCNQLIKNKLLDVTDYELLEAYVTVCNEVWKVQSALQDTDANDKNYSRLRRDWSDLIGRMERLGSKFGFNPV